MDLNGKDKSQATMITGNGAAQQASLSAAEGSGRYTITKTLGKGAMGVVYLAHDSVLERDVAIKELHANLAANSELMDRFRREAKVLAKMAHQGIVQIYDLVETNNCVWIVMEFVRGEDLSAYLQRKKALTSADVITIGAQIADALAYAHSVGIVHRDLKPANILLTGHGMPKIMDFGLAKLAQSAQHTAAGTILGTPAYMSPEQAAGQAADARSDIYSLGIALYHMATGKVPFTGELASILAQHINTEPKLPREINSQVPAKLQDVILSLLIKDPAKRVQDMTAVAGMLRGTVKPIVQSSEAANATAGSSNSGIGSLLEQKEKLEQMIKEQYTRHITVMFTDLKGSTAIADLQGNLAARAIIKKHMDILNPIIKENSGKLVKTMGDGTMSYYPKEIDAVRAAVDIQKGINEYNDTIEGQGKISLRAGISSGTAFVEDNDIFGDVVNVSSRFEAACNSGEIYISEETYEGLKENKEEFFIRHIRNVFFKGKSTPVKIFKVFYKPVEIEEEKRNPTKPAAAVELAEASKVTDAVAAGAGAAPVQAEPQGIQSNVSVFSRAGRPASAAPQAASGGAKMTEHKQQASGTDKELGSCIVKNGDVLKLTNEKYRVTGEIIVAKGGVLVLDKAELYFAENAGIVSMGVIRAVNSVFSAIDPVKGWRNVVIAAEGDRVIEIDSCKFYFGRGRTPEALKACADIVIAWPQSNIYYGGGLMVAGGNAKSLQIRKTSFHKCLATEGGGIYFYRSTALLDGCLFEECMTKNGSGGGIHTFNSDILINKCAFTKCSSGNSGGGACFTSSKNNVTESVFKICMSKRGGGAIACVASSPQIKGCLMETCSSTTSGGGIYKDNKSVPLIDRTSFQKCKPNDMA